MVPKPTRIKGIEYPSTLSLVLRKREYITDVDGYYELLGIDPNEKNWSKAEIKERFRKLFKEKGHDPSLIEAYKTLTSTKRVQYDSLVKSIEKMLEGIYTGKIKIEKEMKTESKNTKKYAYYVDECTEENYDLAVQWMQIVATFNHRLNIDEPTKVVLSNKFEKAKYPWGTLVYVNTNVDPNLDILAHYLLKDESEGWYLKFCKITRNWDENRI